MSILTQQVYKPPQLLFNRHLETIYPALFRKVRYENFKRVSITTQDDDFLDLDWYKGYSPQMKRIAIICHGLEGDSARPYMKGMARAFNLNQWDAIAWNYRGCGDRINLQKIYYHSGATYDLEEIVTFAEKKYQQIFLIGFSLGGNLVLKYLGEKIRRSILGVAVFSVPLDLHSCSLEMEKQHNLVYSMRFLRNLKKKINAKKKVLASEFPVMYLSKITSLYEFDDLFTAPLHGFENALDYYKKCSSLNFLENIQSPTLIVNAKNDPFLTDKCFPEDLLENNVFVRLETQEKGGHVGFSLLGQPIYWSEQKALDFANNL